MKMKSLYVIPIVLLLVIFLAVFILPARMTVAVIDNSVSIKIYTQYSPDLLYEYYNTGENAYRTQYGARRSAQTITPSVSDYKVTSVKIKAYRAGSPGTLTMAIKAVDGSSHPTGADLCSGTTNGNDFTTNTAGDWYEIILGAGYDLSLSTKYACVLSGGVDSSNYVRWLRDDSGDYAGGCEEDSADSGSTWTANALADMMFETWGDPIGGAPSISNSPSSKAFGVIWPSSTYWSNTGNTTGFTGTLDDAEAYFTLTNDGDTTVDVSVNGTNWSGGVGWSIVQAAPGSDEVRMSVFKEGDGTGDNVTITTSPQAFISGLAASGNTTDWELKLETGSAFTDGVAKSSTITLIASAT